MWTRDGGVIVVGQNLIAHGADIHSQCSWVAIKQHKYIQFKSIIYVFMDIVQIYGISL